MNQYKRCGHARRCIECVESRSFSPPWDFIADGMHRYCLYCHRLLPRSAFNAKYYGLPFIPCAGCPCRDSAPTPVNEAAYVPQPIPAPAPAQRYAVLPPNLPGTGEGKVALVTVTSAGIAAPRVDHPPKPTERGADPEVSRTGALLAPLRPQPQQESPSLPPPPTRSPVAPTSGPAAIASGPVASGPNPPMSPPVELSARPTCAAQDTFPSSRASAPSSPPLSCAAGGPFAVPKQSAAGVATTARPGLDDKAPSTDPPPAGAAGPQTTAAATAPAAVTTTTATASLKTQKTSSGDISAAATSPVAREPPAAPRATAEAPSCDPAGGDGPAGSTPPSKSRPAVASGALSLGVANHGPDPSTAAGPLAKGTDQTASAALCARPAEQRTSVKSVGKAGEGVTSLIAADGFVSPTVADAQKTSKSPHAPADGPPKQPASSGAKVRSRPLAASPDDVISIASTTPPPSESVSGLSDFEEVPTPNATARW